LTPRTSDRDPECLQFDVAVHGEGAASRWAATAAIGSPVAVSGPARGYEVDPAMTAMVLGGDETAFAAVGQIIEQVASTVPVSLYFELAPGGQVLPVPSHPRLEVNWLRGDGRVPGGELAAALSGAQFDDGTRLWAAGEAAAMQRVRRQLHRERNISRSHAVIRGYWKWGRESDGVGDAV
jgi:NADPH-dependent ferric siderophore reductase